MKGIKKMAERKPYTTKTRQIILEYLKSQKAVTVSVADIEKYLKTEGFIRIQYSVYAKLCINNDSAKTIQKRLKNNVPDNGDIRYLIITERQYQNIVNMNSNYTLQENITTTDRTLIIGGLNSENNT